MLLYTVKTFNGHTINDSSYKAVIKNANIPAAAKLSLMEIPGADPRDIGVFSGAERSIAVQVESRSGVPSTRRTQDETLKLWFKRGTVGQLVATNAIDSQDYQIYGRVQSMAPGDGNSWIIVIVCGSSTWRRVAVENYANWAASGSALTNAISVSGSEYTRLIASLTPDGAPAAGWRYQNVYQFYNPKSIDWGMRPWCITIDTAALVSAGKCKSDCSDFRLTINGVDTRRYIADANTDHTNFWFNPRISKGRAFKLKTAIAGTGNIGEIQFAVNDDTRLALTAVPEQFVVFHGTEWLLCYGKNLRLCKAGVIKRGYMGTALAAHSAGDVFYWIESVVTMAYGNAAATDPALDDSNYDDDKPGFDLALSDNNLWVWTDTSTFYDPDHPTRPGTWSPAIQRDGDVTDKYLVGLSTNGAGDPAMGMLIAAWQRNGRWQSENAKIGFYLDCPGGFAEISVTGSKKRTTVRWASNAGLFKSANRSNWDQVWGETSPVTVNAWTDFTHADAVIAGNVKHVKLALAATLTNLANGAVYFEILTSTADFYQTNLPSGTLLGEATSYPMQIRLRNNTTGHEVTITTPVIPGKTYLLDSENNTVTYDGANAHGTYRLDDESRDVLLDLAPGTNNLEIIPLTDMGNVTVALSAYPRRP